MEASKPETSQNSSFKTEFPNSHFSQTVVENPSLFNFMDYGELVRSVYISTKHKYIFFDIPKNASSSVKTFLYRLESGVPDWNFSFFAEIHDRNFSPLLSPLQVPNFKALLNDPDYFLFCIFRNPFERLVSSYLDQVMANKQYIQEINAINGNQSQELPSFGKFIYWLCTLHYSNMDPHMMPQYIKSYAHAIRGMQLFSFNKLDELQRVLSDRANAPNVMLPEISQHGTNAALLVEKYYTAETRLAVENKFAADVAAWNRVTNLQTESRNGPPVTRMKSGDIFGCL